MELIKMRKILKTMKIMDDSLIIDPSDTIADVGRKETFMTTKTAGTCELPRGCA